MDNQKRRSAIVGLFLFGLIIAGDLVSAFVGMASPVSPVVPVPTTFIVQSVGNGASYNAYLSASSTIPFFTETNITKLVNNDMLTSSSCTIVGCSINFNPGLYNLTQGIQVNIPNVAFFGSPAADFVPQPLNNTYSNCGSSIRPAFCTTSVNTIFQGFKIDDFNRVRKNGETGDAIAITSTASGSLVQSMTIWNASNNGVNIQGSNTIVTTSTIYRFLVPKVIPGGNFGILAGATSGHTRLFLNAIGYFNGTDVSGVQASFGASYLSITANDLFNNSFGISTTWGKFLTINGNTIHNNFAGGILMTTLGAGTQTGGPATIAENVVTDNGQEINTDAQCNNLHCSGIILKAARPQWETVSLTGNVLRDTQTVPTQWFDIHIFGTGVCASSACYSNLTITGNSLGRTASGTVITSTVTPVPSWTFSGNTGFNPVGHITNFLCGTASWCPFGTASTITASTTYTAINVNQQWTCTAVSSGINTVFPSITLMAFDGTTLTTGLTCGGSMQPITMLQNVKVNFGAFVNATVTVVDIGN